MKNKKTKNIITFIVIVVLTAIVLYFSLKNDFNSIINYILSIKFHWILLGLLLVLSYWILRAITLYMFAIKFKKKYSFKKSLYLIITTQFFNAVTPFATGGQPYEIYSLKKDGFRVTEATNISIQNFIVYQIALVLLGIFALIYNYFFEIISISNILTQLILLGFLINFLVIVGLFIISFTENIKKNIIHFLIELLSKTKIIKNKNKKIEYWDKVLINFNNGAKILFENKTDFIKTIIFSLFSLISIYLIPLIILYGLGDYTSVSSINVIVTTSFVMLIGSFVPTPGGTGGLEFGFMQLFSKFIIGSKLSAVMLLWRFLTYYLGMIVGAILLNFKKGGT